MLVKLLAKMLKIANSNPTPCSNEFYRVKDRILTKWGKPDGFDTQIIEKVCWGCNGTGDYNGRTCYKCGGDGIYSIRTITLARYRLADQVFHRPTTAGSNLEGKERNVIYGKVKHDRYDYHLETEMMFWFLLVFDPKTFAKRIGCVYNYTRVRTPMVLLSNILFEVRRIRRSWKVRNEWRKIDSEETKSKTDEIPF